MQDEQKKQFALANKFETLIYSEYNTTTCTIQSDQINQLFKIKTYDNY